MEKKLTTALFAGVEPTGDAPGEFHLVDGMLHCISMPTGPRLNRLAETYELIWATGWRPYDAAKIQPLIHTQVNRILVPVSFSPIQ